MKKRLLESLKKLPKLQMRAEFVPSTLNEETRTISVIWTTGYKGLRSTAFGDYYEELSLDPAHVRMDHLKSGRAKFLAAHDMRSLDSVLGVIESADIGTATVRFSKDDISERNLQKIRDGILTDISVGYSVKTYEEVEGSDPDTPTLRAIDWTPIEVSLVPVGFDPGAVVRSEVQTENDVEIITRSKTNTEVQVMDEIEKKRLEQEKLENAKKEERTRALEIRKAVKDAKLDEKIAEEYIERGTSVEEARTNISLFAKYAKEQAATQIDTTVRVEVGTTDQEKKRTGLQDALLNRIDRKNFEVSDAARQFTGKSVLRMVEDLVGRQLGESDAALAKRAMSSSDLPLILANVAEKSAQKRYSLAPRTWQQWCGKDTLRNYKEAKQLRGGDFASLVERKEHGEFQYGSFSEEQETAQLADYGIIHKYTSQMIVNDDMSMIQKVSSEGGVAAARLENRLAYSALSTNKVMGDSVALYHADHGNLGTPGAFSSTTFSAAFLAMRSQTSVDGRDPLNIAPKFLIVPPSLEAAAKQFLALVQPAVNSNVNIYSNSVQLVVDAQLSDDKYYFVADPSEIAGVVMFHLEGQESPTIESRTNWSDNSVELKVAHTVACAPMDWRALYRNEIA
jgi:hypothetical protein